MSRGRTRRVVVTRVDGGQLRREPDELVVEEPLEIRLDGHVAATTMRTPGHDFELAVGLMHGDGLLAGHAVTGIRYCGDHTAGEGEFNIVTVETGGRAPVPAARLTTTSSACGLCGSVVIDELCDRLSPLPPTAVIPLDTMTEVPEQVRARQELFAGTGAVHAAAVFDRDGQIRIVREDIGRHNAVDKVVGRMLLDGQLPAAGLGLFVSGRASFEMVQKAWAAGFSTVLAVSAPSALAVDVARRAGLVLVGFARGSRMNVYSPERWPGAEN